MAERGRGVAHGGLRARPAEAGRGLGAVQVLVLQVHQRDAATVQKVLLRVREAGVLLGQQGALSPKKPVHQVPGRRRETSDLCVAVGEPEPLNPQWGIENPLTELDKTDRT